MKLLAALLTISSLTGFPVARAEPVLALATLEPLRLLIESLAAGHLATATLFPTPTGHHASLRPSQLRQLRKASLFVWIGSGMEVGLVGEVERLPASTTIITMIESAQTGEGTHPETQQASDPHVWLDPVAVRELAPELTAAMIAMVPAHKADFISALDRFRQDIDQLEAQFQAEFAPLKEGGLLASHDAYRRFFSRFGLKQLAALRDHEDRPPGARRVARFFQLASSEEAVCLVADSKVAQQRVSRLLPDGALRQIVLPPTGPTTGLLLDYQAFLSWFANRLLTCMQGPSV